MHKKAIIRRCDPTNSSVTIVIGYHPHWECVSMEAIWESYGGLNGGMVTASMVAMYSPITTMMEEWASMGVIWESYGGSNGGMVTDTVATEI